MDADSGDEIMTYKRCEKLLNKRAPKWADDQKKETWLAFKRTMCVTVFQKEWRTSFPNIEIKCGNIYSERHLRTGGRRAAFWESGRGGGSKQRAKRTRIKAASTMQSALLDLPGQRFSHRRWPRHEKKTKKCI